MLVPGHARQAWEGAPPEWRGGALHSTREGKRHLPRWLGAAENKPMREIERKEKKSCWVCCHTLSCASPSHSAGQALQAEGRSVCGWGTGTEHVYRARVLPDGSMFQKTLSL